MLSFCSPSWICASDPVNSAESTWLLSFTPATLAVSAQFSVSVGQCGQ